MFDLLIQDGLVIDPRNGIGEKRDLAVSSGKVAAVDVGIPSHQARSVIPASGLVVTPGLIDLHVHLFATTGMPRAWAGDWSVYPDGFSFRSGVTTMVDTGSSGWRNFEDFRRRVIDRSLTRVLALLNIVGMGMLTEEGEQNAFDMDPVTTARMAKDHPSLVAGIKCAHYRGPEWVSVDRALEAGELCGLPVMVDFGYFVPERPYSELVTKRLRSGDISTHVFRGPVPIIDGHGKVYPYLFKARERGVLFDVGHGAGSFVFRNALPAIQQGFYPDTISTDLHALSMNGPLMDLPTTLSKFLALGMDLDEVIQRATDIPARAIGREDLGHLSPGAPADLAVFRIDEGEYYFGDTGGGRFPGRQRLFCELTLKDGEVMWDWNARTFTDFRELGDRYGVREGEFILDPDPRS